MVSVTPGCFVAVRNIVLIGPNINRYELHFILVLSLLQPLPPFQSPDVLDLKRSALQFFDGSLGFHSSNDKMLARISRVLPRRCTPPNPLRSQLRCSRARLLHTKTKGTTVISPPICRRTETLNREAFCKTFDILAVHVPTTHVAIVDQLFEELHEYVAWQDHAVWLNDSCCSIQFAATPAEDTQSNRKCKGWSLAITEIRK